MPFFIDIPPSVKEVEKTKIEYTELKEDEMTIDESLLLMEIDEDFIEQSFLKSKFDSLVQQWKESTMFDSSISKIINDESFQRIIHLGERAIPLIIDEIEKEPSVLVWALNILTNSDLNSGQRLTIEGACRAWVKLYKKHQPFL